MSNRPYLQAHPVHATPLPKPSRALFHFVELAVLVAGIGVVLAVIIIYGAPVK